MNKPIGRLAIALGVLFAALFVNLNIVQVVEGHSLRNNPQNRRVLLNEYAHPRGPIVASGTSIALSKATNGELKYLRRYPWGPVFAPVTGYNSFTYGSSGIEEAENGILSGDDPRLFTSNLGDILTGRNPRGGTVVLTINKATQQAAYRALGNRRGAVVALNPSTGAILAAVSKPSYDPNSLSSHNADEIARAYSCYVELDTTRQPDETTRQLHHHIRAQLRARERRCRGVPENPTAYFRQDPFGVSPLVNRAFREIYPSGSVFKIIDSAAALSTGRYSPTTQIPAPNSYWPLHPGRTALCSSGTSVKTGPCIENFDGEICQNGRTAPLAFAFAKSCNTAFAKLAVRLGGKAIAAEAHAFGLDNPYPGQGPPDFCDPPAFRTPLPVCRSTPGSQEDLAAPDTLAQTAIGQQGVGITPLQAAMLAAAVAHHGTLMQPYLVQKELGPNLSPLPVQRGGQLSQVLDPTTDQKLMDMMHGVVTAPEGTGLAANIPNMYVGGKTGTAEHCVSNSPKCPPPYDWFTGFALDKGEPKIAVSVIIENEAQGTGGITSAPVAKQVMLAYLRSPGGG